MKKKNRNLLIGVAIVAAGVALLRRPASAPAPVKPTAGGGLLPRSPKTGALPASLPKNDAIGNTPFHYAL